jgi:hypothetical protein
MDAFQKLAMQITDISQQEVMTYYLKGLSERIRSPVESNKMNLTDMVTLPAACARQDEILWLTSSYGKNQLTHEHYTEKAHTAQIEKVAFVHKDGDKVKWRGH